MGVTFRFLFDECLTLELTDLAHGLGFEATSVRDLNRLSDSDPSLALFAREKDWVFVTNNRIDYVRLYARFDLHPGLVVIIPNRARDEQLRLFQQFILQLPSIGDLVNRLVEIEGDGTVTVVEWPPERRNDEI